MPVLTLEESADSGSGYGGPIPDDTIFRAKITGIREQLSNLKDDNGEKLMRMSFTFVLDAADDQEKAQWDGQRVWGETGVKFVNHANCKLYMWAQEILGSELPVGFVLDTDTLIGNMVRVIIGLRTYQKDGREQTKNFVKDVFRDASAVPAYASSAPTYPDEAPF